MECGDGLPEGRVELGYDYCTKDACQAKRHRGLKITAIGVNKSSDVFIVADEDELGRRADAGEFARKDTGLDAHYRDAGGQPGPRPPTAQRRRQPGRVAPVRRPWTSEQEKIVRLYHEMGLTPAQIVERAGRNTPRLGITAGLVTRILSAPPRRR
ncbi:MAG TPA: hypothetical protein VGJ95_14605 [Pseudonocardiaceae bacterium]